MTIISIDPSMRSTGIVIHRDGEIILEAFTIDKKKNREEVLLEIFDRMDDIASEYKPEYLIIENYSFGSNGTAMTKQAEIGGIIRVMFLNTRAKLIEMPIPTWKAIACHRIPKRTKQEKVDYIAAAEAVTGIQGFETVDVADAAMMLWAVKQIAERKTEKGRELYPLVKGIKIEYD